VRSGPRLGDAGAAAIPNGLIERRLTWRKRTGSAAPITSPSGRW